MLRQGPAGTVQIATDRAPFAIAGREVVDAIVPARHLVLQPLALLECVLADLAELQRQLRHLLGTARVVAVCVAPQTRGQLTHRLLTLLRPLVVLAVPVLQLAERTSRFLVRASVVRIVVGHVFRARVSIDVTFQFAGLVRYLLRHPHRAIEIGCRRVARHIVELVGDVLEQLVDLGQQTPPSALVGPTNVGADRYGQRAECQHAKQPG